MSNGKGLLEMFDGVQMSVKGIRGRFKYTPAHMAPNGLFYVSASLIFEPDSVGRRSKRYQEHRRVMGDDYVIDYSQDIDTLIDLLDRLGPES